MAAKNKFQGGMPTLTPYNANDRMRKLDEVNLYSKKDYNTSLNPVPIKTVHFVYSYALCPNAYNNTGTTVTVNSVNVNANKGKLTLEKLYFTYQNSIRGALSPYVFNYGNLTPGSIDNPYYNSRDMDRWGNFKMNSTSYGTNYPYIDFPYTNQFQGNYTTTSNNQPPDVAYWSLKQIELPSSGTVKVKYESDDYAYVENEKAMRMFDIYQLGSQSNNNSNDRNGSINLHDTEAPGANTVWIQLETPMSSADFYKKYLNNGNVKKIYFKIYSKLMHHITLLDVYDYVTGYAELDLSTYGVSGNLGYVRLKPVTLDPLSGQQVSPFTKAALQHLRINRPELVHDFQPANSSNVLDNIINFIGSVWVAVQG